MSLLPDIRSAAAAGGARLRESASPLDLALGHRPLGYVFPQPFNVVDGLTTCPHCAHAPNHTPA